MASTKESASDVVLPQHKDKASEQFCVVAVPFIERLLERINIVLKTLNDEWGVESKAIVTAQLATLSSEVVSFVDTYKPLLYSDDDAIRLFFHDAKNLLMKVAGYVDTVCDNLGSVSATYVRNTLDMAINRCKLTVEKLTSNIDDFETVATRLKKEFPQATVRLDFSKGHPTIAPQKLYMILGHSEKLG